MREHARNNAENPQNVEALYLMDTAPNLFCLFVQSHVGPMSTLKKMSGLNATFRGTVRISYDKMDYNRIDHELLWGK